MIIKFFFNFHQEMSNKDNLKRQEMESEIESMLRNEKKLFPNGEQW